MNNVIPMVVPKLTELEELARDINDMIGEVGDLRLQMAYKLARAREVCRAAGITFKEWCIQNVEYNWQEAAKLALVGSSDNPPQALEDLRTNQRERQARYKAKLLEAKQSVSATRVETVYPSDEDDSNDGVRIRGFFARAEDAASFALDDNMQGIVVTNEMVTAAREAARAWGDLAKTLEETLEEMANAQEN